MWELSFNALQKMNKFILSCARLFVTLAPPKLLCSEKLKHVWLFSRFFVTLSKTAKLLRLGMKNESIHFVLRSTFRNFVPINQPI